jgi:hypothetical protein
MEGKSFDMLRILDQLDQRQLRLGTIGALVHVAGRNIDARTALLRRFQKFLFAKVRCGTDDWGKFAAHIDPNDVQALAQKAKGRRGNWVYVAELWLADSRMPSKVGPFDEHEKRAAVFVDLARQLGVVGSTFALTETGTVLKSILPKFRDLEPDPNPLLVAERLAEKALYSRILLSADVVTPFLIDELCNANPGDATNSQPVLKRAVERLMQKTRASADVSGAMATRKIWEYSRRLESEKAAEHNVRPRMEFYVDIGLLARPEGSSGATYRSTVAGRNAALEWAPLRDDPRATDSFLNSRFFTSFAMIHGLGPKSPIDERTKLSFFVRAFPKVCRPIGFTPARTAALAACLECIVRGVVVEVADLLATVRSASHGPWARWLHYSGGSRFDDELLVRVEPELLTRLENASE